MNRLVSLVTSLLIGAAAAWVPPAVASVEADSALVWGYDDPPRDGRKTVDVLRTQLDMNVDGHYRIRVYGRDFIKNKTDIVRIYFDTDRSDWGPEFRLSWYFGRNPARPAGHMSLRTIEYWDQRVDSKTPCPGMKHQVNYARDVITVVIARRCVGYPKALRWAGFVAWIYDYDADAHSFHSHQDQFPASRVFSAIG